MTNNVFTVTNVTPIKVEALLAHACEALQVLSASGEPTLFINQRTVDSILAKNAREAETLKDEIKSLNKLVDALRAELPLELGRKVTNDE